LKPKSHEGLTDEDHPKQAFSLNAKGVSKIQLATDDFQKSRPWVKVLLKKPLFALFGVLYN
jgi:hypothetical protein